MINRKSVALLISWKVVQHLFLWLPVCELHCTFCKRWSHDTFSHDHWNSLWVTLHILCKAVSSHLSYNNRKWVTQHTLWTVISSHLFLWPTGSEWHCIVSCESSHGLIILFPMTNSEWVTLHSWWMASHHLISYDQQEVGDIVHFVKSCLSHLSLWPTASEWHCTFCERQASSHPFLLKTACGWHHTCCGSSPITSFLITDSREWVTSTLLWKVISSHHLWSSTMITSLWVMLQIF